MSLATKIDEVRSVILDLKPNLGLFTETWLKDTVRDSHLCIPGYSFIYRNRTTDHHGGVGLYIENSIKFKRLDNLLDPDIEALWAWLRPSRLPSGVPCLIAGVLYHPYFNDSYRDAALANYLSASLSSMEGEYPGCGFLLCGDFNRLNIRRLTTQFQLKKLVDKPTRGDQILDSVISNLPQLYDANSLQALPPFGLSDHKVVLVDPKARQVEKGSSRKTGKQKVGARTLLLVYRLVPVQPRRFLRFLLGQVELVGRHDSHWYGSHHAGQTPKDSRQRCAMDHNRVQKPYQATAASI